MSKEFDALLKEEKIEKIQKIVVELVNNSNNEIQELLGHNNIKRMMNYAKCIAYQALLIEDFMGEPINYSAQKITYEQKSMRESLKVFNNVKIAESWGINCNRYSDILHDAKNEGIEFKTFYRIIGSMKKFIEDMSKTHKLRIPEGEKGKIIELPR